MDQICSKRVFPVENEKSEHHHCILHIRIALSTKFHFTQTIFNFGTKFAQKGYFLSKTKKVNIIIEFYIFELILAAKFHFKRTILNFGIKFAQKRYFRLKTKKVNTTIEFCIFELFWVPDFTLNKQFWNLGPNLPRKGIFGPKQKSEHHHWILHIQISLGTKFQLKLTIFTIWTKKVNITIELCIFEIDYGSSFSLNWHFLVFGSNLP